MTLRPRRLQCVLLAVTVFAGARAGDISVVLTPAVVSQYMFRGVRLGGPAFQPSVELDRGALAAGIWVTTPLADRVPGVSAPEIDPYVIYTFTLNDRITLVPGCSWYNYPRADPSAGFYRSSLEPYVTANFTAGPVTVSPKLYYDVVLDGPTGELNASWTVPLASRAPPLTLGATIGTYTWRNSVRGARPAVRNRGDYFQIGGSLPFALDARTRLTVGLAYVRGSNNRFETAGLPPVRNQAAVGRVVASLSGAFSF